MKLKLRLLWLMGLLLLYSGWAVTPAFAHALLIRSNPAANAVLTVPPVQVELFFSEPAEEQLSSIKVFDINGSAVDVGDVRVDAVDPTRLTVSLHTLGEGIYTVTWKVVSAIDGHQTVGTFPFAVGDANAAAVQAISASTTTSLPLSALFSKFLMLATLALLVGQPFFTKAIWKPVLRVSPTEQLPPAWKTVYRWSLIGLLLAIALGILSQAGQSMGAELAAPWNPETGRMLTETRLGAIWLARLALALLVIWLMSQREWRFKDWLLLLLNSALLFAVTLTSHAATEAKPFLPVLSDWLHLMGMASWFGGLVYFVTGLHYLMQTTEPMRTQLTSLLVKRFSAHALIIVALIGITGLYAAYLRVGHWSSLVATIYGHVLLIKQGLVGGLILVAGTNLLIISPLLNRARLHGESNAKVVNIFGKLLLVEITLAGLLLASVSYLTYLPPAKLASVNSDLTGSKKVDDLLMEVDISPGRVGQNQFMLMLSSNGQPVESTKQVLLRFTPSQANVPPSELQLIGEGGGMFSAKGTYLSLPGSWQVQAVVRRVDKFDAYANFDFKLQKPGVTENTVSPKLIGGLILLLGLLLGLMDFSARASKLTRFGLGLPLAIIMLASGIYYVTSPAVVSNEQANPIPPNRQSIAAGQALYTVHCLPCHGPSGKGDGPLGLVLNPRPADLTLHAVPGVHTDAQLFEWITNGFPGSAMPAWKTKLSDTDRWNLVNFIRAFAPKQ